MDGSKNDEEKGARVFGPGTNHSKPQETCPRVFQADIDAVGRCSQPNLDRKCEKQSIAIVPDSQTAVLF